MCVASSGMRPPVGMLSEAVELFLSQCRPRGRSLPSRGVLTVTHGKTQEL